MPLNNKLFFLNRNDVCQVTNVLKSDGQVIARPHLKYYLNYSSYWNACASTFSHELFDMALPKLIHKQFRIIPYMRNQSRINS